MFVFACGSGSEKTPERPSGSPPEAEEPKGETPPEEPEVPTPPETIVAFGEVVGTRNLYDAEEIEVFYSVKVAPDSTTRFEDMLTVCLVTGVNKGYSTDNIGLLSGIGIEEGHTKDFLLNPDVERTYSHATLTQKRVTDRVNAEFDDPLANNVLCGTDTPCKKLMCGAIKGD